jgi:hypothetical protein
MVEMKVASKVVKKVSFEVVKMVEPMGELKVV